MNEDMPIGINPIILNEKGEILLGRRTNKYGAGTYCTPGGRLKVGETFETCAAREIFEETGLIVKESDIEVINFANAIDNENEHYVQIGLLIKKYKGIPKIKEPEFFDDLQFFSLNNLPSIFKKIKPNIELFKNKKFYDKDVNINE